MNDELTGTGETAAPPVLNSGVDPALLPRPVYTVKITKTWKELGEVGHEYKAIGKDEKDENIYGYTPNQIGIVKETRDVLVKVIDGEIDLPAIERACNRRPRKEAE